MASDVSRDTYQGLLVGDPRLRDSSCLWSAQSSYTQAGPKPGVPVASGSSQMVLQASGEQASGSSINLLVQRAGMPGPGGAGLVWTNTGDTLYRGWDVPSVVTGWEAVEWTDGGAPNLIREIGPPHAVKLEDQTVLVTAQVRHVSGVTTTYRVYVWKRDPDTGAWTSQSVYSQSAAPAFGFYPCLLPLPGGRVLLYYQLDDTANDEVQVQLQYSDDDGDAWTVGNTSCLTTPIDVGSSPGASATGGDPGRMRVAVKDGQVLMVIEYRQHNTSPNWREVFLQYASSDLGCSFDVVGDAWDGDASGEGAGKYHDLLVLAGKFQMVYVSGEHDNRPHIRAISNAYERLASVEPTQILLGVWATESGGATNETYTDGDLAAWVDDDGTAYVVGRMTDSTDEVVIGRSLDGGDTWEMLGTSDFSTGFADPVGKVFDFDDTNTYPKNFCATAQGGRTLLLHNWAANPGDEDNSLGCAYLGGWSTVTMPSWSTTRGDLYQVGWTATWLPLELPSDMGWTGAGAGTASLTSGTLSLSTAATAISYSRNPAGTIAEGMIVRLSCKVTSGGSLGADSIGVRLRLADGTDDYDVSIRIRLNAGNHEVRVRDNNGAAAVGSDMIVTGTDGVDLIIAFGGATIATWYRARSLGTDREFSAGPTSSSLTDDAATPAANNLIEWGHISSSTSESSWYEVHYVTDEYTGIPVDSMAEGQDNPDDLFPKTVSSEYVYIDSGAKVRAVDGPALAGESWTLATRYEYGIDRIFPSASPSPRVQWRSTSTAQQTIALAFDASLLGTVESALGNSAIGLYLGGINWRTGTWQGYDVDTAAWVTIASIDTSTNMTGLDWVRQGNTVIPDVSGAGDQPYLHMNEAAGWTWGYNGVTFRRVLASTEGRWDRTSGTVKRPTLMLQSVAGGDPTSGGSAYLMPTSYLCVVYTSAKYAGYRLLISNQTTVDGYFTIGTLLVGPVVLFGRPYAWGRRIETEAGAEVTEARDRTSRSRVLAPPRRAVEFSWVDGVELSGVEGGDPNYVLASTTSGVPPAASEMDVPYVLDGLTGLLDGPHRPILYLPRLVKGPPDTQHFNRRHQYLYGRTMGSVSVESVLGDELDSELVRVGAIAIREEP